MDVLACKIDKELESVEYDNVSSGIKVSQKTLDDYWRFFTTEEGADILPYAYMGPSHYYNDLIKNCEDYYLCKDEIEILSKNKEAFKKHLSGIECVMEIGPGSVHAVENKSLNILNSAKDLKVYQGLDYSQSYLKEACNIIKFKLSGIIVKQTKVDLLEAKEIKSEEYSYYKKAIVFLGGTLANFKLEQQKHIINQFSKLANEGDLLVLTVDTNEDKKSLLKAYNNQFALTHVKSALGYYARINPIFEKYVDYFDINVTLNEVSRAVEFDFVVKENFSFQFDQKRITTLIQGQRLKGIISYKPSLNNIKNVLNNYYFDIIETLTNSKRKINILICKKTR